MVLPRSIAPTDPIDPLLLLPVPNPLPADPSKSLQSILNDLEPILSGDISAALPPAVITAQIRHITRDAQSILNAARVDAARAREDLDRRDTVLRGVEYERNRIREEIERCMEYVPAYTAAALPDQTVFMANASDELKAGLHSEEYAFALIIARLEQELKEIQQLETDVSALKKDRDALVRTKREIKQKMDSLEVWLSDFSRSTTAVASKLKEPLIAAPTLSSTTTSIVIPSATTLPAPDINITSTSTPDPA